MSAQAILTPGDLAAPRVVSMRDLVQVLGPKLLPYLGVRELILELHDLWMMGAPEPQNFGGVPEEPRRVLIHTQFNKWWHEVCARHGIPIPPIEALRGLGAG